LFSECISQVKFFKVFKIREYSWMAHGGDNVEIIVVQDQSPDIVHFVEGLSLDLLDPVVGQVDHLQLLMLAPDAQQVPGQSFKMISIEDKYFCFFGSILDDIRVGEARVGAVGDVHLLVRLPLPVVTHSTRTPLLIPLRTSCMVPLVPHIAGGQGHQGAEHHQGECVHHCHCPAL